MSKRKAAPQPAATPAEPHIYDDVPAAWLLRALVLTFAAMALMLYLIYATLFYFGQWQIVLHPSHTLAATPASAYEPLRFGVDATGQPQLTGWWIPADPNSRYANFTLLYLHSGDGSLADTLLTLHSLHSLGINLFAIDYRGFGQSSGGHPTESTMNADSTAAFNYLVDTRHILPTQIIAFGDGMGATLAARLASAHQAMPAVILRNPPVNLLAVAAHDSRSRLLPTALLFHERFTIAPTLATLSTPKLLLASSDDPSLAALFHTAASPKHEVTLPATVTPAQAADEFSAAITRFLDDNLSLPPAMLTP